MRRRAPRPTGAALRLGGIGFGVLGAAVNTGNNLLYLLLGLLLGSVLVSWVVARRNVAGLRLAVRVPPTVRAGRAFALEVEVLNGARRGAARALELTLAGSRGGYGPATIERLAAGARTRLVIPGRESVRGPVRIASVRVASSFPLGLLRVSREERLDVELLVLPRPTAAPEGSPTAGARPGEARTDAGTGSEYVGLRQGREGEDVRRVDWKSTARRGTLVLRETCGEGERHVRLDVATRVAGDPRDARERFERSVREIAGRGQATLEAGGTVRLTVDGTQAATYEGRSAVNALLRRLARLEPTDEQGRALPPEALVSRPSAADARGHEPRNTPPGRALRLSSTLALAIGALALYAYGGIHVLVFAAIAVSIAVTTWRPGVVARPGTRRRAVWNAIAVLVLGAVAFEMLLRNPLAASLHLVAFIAVYLAGNATTVREDRQTLLVSMLFLVLAAALTTDVAFAVPLLAWLAVACHARIADCAVPPPRCASSAFDPARRRARYAAPALRLAGAVVLVGVAAFFVVPHFGTGTFALDAGRTPPVSGFSETARLGDLGRIKLDRTPVMEVRVGGTAVDPAELRWRGTVLDRFDGRTWSRTRTGGELLRADPAGRFDLSGGALDRPGAVRGRLVQEFRIDTAEPPVLFAAARAEQIRSRDFRLLAVAGDGVLRLAQTPRGRLVYEAVSVVVPRDPARLSRAGGDDPPEIVESATRLPRLDPRLDGLARRVTNGAATRYQAARAIESWLQTSLAYSLDAGGRADPDPLAAFVFEGRAGHCEYFATAMVVLARLRGIPARLATGYLAGEPNRFDDSLVVRRSDAHAWVEVYFPGDGWVTFDPTPPAGRVSLGPQGAVDFAADLHAAIARWWDDYVIGIDLEDQWRGVLNLADAVARLFAVAGRLAAPAAIALLLAALALAVHRRARARARRGSAGVRPAPPTFYHRLLSILARRKLRRRPAETAAEFARRIAPALSPAAAEALSGLTALYYRERFGGAPGDPAAAARARALLRVMRARDSWR